MTIVNISDQIEHYVSGQDKYEYRLFLSSDLVNPIYEGIVYPFPQFRNTTKQGVIKLNDVMENYVKFEDFHTTNIAPLNNSVHLITPTIFSLYVFDGTSYVLTINYAVLNQWLKVDSGGLGQILLKNTDNLSNNYNNICYAPLYSGGYVSTTIDPLIIDVRTYSNGLQTSIQTVSYQSLDECNIAVLAIKGNSTQYRSKVVNGTTYITDKIVVSLPVIQSEYNPNDITPIYSFKINSCSDDNYIYWLNTYGQLEHIGGSLSDKTNTVSTVNDYESDYRTLVDGYYEGTAASQGIKRNIVNYTDIFTIKTKLLTTVEHNSLKDLYSSPKVWVFTGGKYYSVLPVDTTYEQHKFQNDKIKSRTITLKKTISSKRR